MNLTRTLVSLSAPIIATAATAQTALCPGGFVNPTIPGLQVVIPAVGVNGDLIAFGHYGQHQPAGGPGAINVFRVLTATDEIVPVEEIVLPGIGSGFGKAVLGAAVASSGVVLLARTEPAPTPVSLFQFKRTSPTGQIEAKRLQGTQSINWTEDQRRFDSDGDRAVLTSWSQTGNGLAVSVSLDFFAVNAAGDWFLEDTVRVTDAWWQYAVRDVRIRGDRAHLVVFGMPRAFAFERTSQGRWQAIDLPSSSQIGDASEIALNGDSVVATYVEAGMSRVEVFDRLATGGWALSATIPVAIPESPDRYPVGLRTSDNLITFAVIDVMSPAPSVTHIYRRSPTGDFSFDGVLAGYITRLTPDFALTPIGNRRLKAIRTSALFGNVRVCEESGALACDGQRAGRLRFLDPSPTQPLGSKELVLGEAPAGQAAFVLGSTVVVPSAGALSSLCVGAAGIVVRIPNVAQTSSTGSASWLLEPDALPLAAGGIVSGAGSQWIFQAVVRSYAGAASSRAVIVQL